MNVYDFDKTIFDGDSTVAYYFFCLKRHKKIIKYFPLLVWAFFKFYIFGIGTKTEFKEKMYRFLRYTDPERDVPDFWNANKCKIKKFYLERQKDDDVIISASPYFLLSPLCREMGIKHLFASNVDSKTGKYTGINCHGKEKVRVFREAFGESEIDEFYSDSYSDSPLAEISKKAFIVKGEKIYPWGTKA